MNNKLMEAEERISVMEDRELQSNQTEGGKNVVSKNRKILRELYNNSIQKKKIQIIGMRRGIGRRDDKGAQGKFSGDEYIWY